MRPEEIDRASEITPSLRWPLRGAFIKPPAMRAVADSYGQIGAFPVACMYGELVRSSTHQGELEVWGDTRVPQGKAPELEAGSTLDMLDSDNQIAGSDSTRIELHVQGELHALGEAASQVLFRSVSGTRGGWYGIVGLDGGVIGSETASGFRNVTIEDAEYCIRDSAGTIDYMFLDRVTLRNFDSMGLFLDNDGSQPAAVCSLQACTVDMRGPDGGPDLGTGIHIRSQGGYLVNASEIQIRGGSEGLYGLFLDVPEVSGGGAFIDSVYVDSLTAGTGVHVADHSPELRGIDAVACKWGIKLSGGGSPSLQKLGSNESDLQVCTTGLYVNDSTTVDVEDVNITVPSGQTGLYTDDASGGSYAGLAIYGGQTGFMAWSTAAHTLRSSSITGFSEFGVKVASAGLVNLGTQSDHGNNNIHESGAVKYVSVKNRVYGLGDVMAEENWWGADPPPGFMFSTSVDYLPAQDEEVPLASNELAIELVPVRPALAFRPNPFHGGGTIEFAVPASKSVSLHLYDVQGRLVREFVSESPSPGTHRLAWNGQDDQGRKVPGGLYFVRLRFDGKALNLKIVGLP